ncbi:NAD(P)-dependent dehydrogenase, short-chain alcohol dehydrogenase family [Saccharopolyspora antimicrobica]|uniref:NAD(P)-dependent dehydrogenase (Short-subunit alcohol dehydrogenase family) n=1 Tax=Saccharopolyspora antimicrobica TaxID=455193 RepID=A0A1I5GRM7_9PSEU|nr:SDR family oxidoreductase [Saccharopolyspora antimicrobica]RKT87408.1 NAD(P)-dependent dehydrogenase (short-subunit alcohol dehydrogenase family) [Saccharopolyspora antimicrobica]SFO38201.1 NAD(P)-dependent dehydrogenase, short-chain alcohol dehydrogenase family [Saccharopolyspora antimicrobica]
MTAFVPVENRYAGRVAVLTGAASGIGRATALRLAAEGAVVHALDMNAAGLEETADLAAGLPGTVRVRVTDVRDRADCFAAIADVVTDSGRLDVLGNIAGIARYEHATQVSEADYRAMMAVNLDGPFFLCQAAIPHLTAHDGNIVNVASTGGLIGQAYTAVYTMSKGALVQLTRSLAVEFMKQNLRINAIAPGAVETPLVTGFAMPDDVDLSLTTNTLTPRPMATADDVAALFCFVASPEARNINGAVLSTDSGVTAA